MIRASGQHDLKLEIKSAVPKYKDESPMHEIQEDFMLSHDDQQYSR